MRKGRLPILVPKGFVVTHRHATLVVGDSSDGAKMVVAAEFRIGCKANEAKQGRPLRAAGRTEVKTSHSPSSVVAERRVRPPASEAIPCETLEHRKPSCIPHAPREANPSRGA